MSSGAFSDAPILCVGAAHWDRIARSNTAMGLGDDAPGRIERRRGGVAANIAAGLAALGHPARLCSVVGDDDAGRALIETLQGQGVDCTDVIRIKDRATDQYIAIEDNNGNLIAAIADATLLEQNHGQIGQRAVQALPRIGAVLLEANLATETLRHIADAAIEIGVDIIANPVSPAKAARLAFLLSGVYRPTLIANLAEANVLHGAKHETAPDAAQALQSRSAGCTLITNGRHEAALAGPDGLVSAMPRPLHGEVSVTGAGDALLSAFLASAMRATEPGDALRVALDAAFDHMNQSRQT